MTDTVDVVVHQMTVASSRALLIELRSTDPERPLPAFRAGSHLDLHLGGLVRQYSLLGDPAERHRYLVCVLREDGGSGGSDYVHRTLRVGERLTVSAPRTTFALDSGAARSILVGGGIGITPLLAMAEDLHRRRAAFELHCYARSEAELPLRDHIEQRPYLARTRFHYSAGGDSLRDGTPAYLADPTDAAVYVCGPTGFIDTVRVHAAAAGWAEDAVLVERFQAGAPIDLAGGEFTVIARSTGQRMPVDDGETIAEVLERHGYEVFLSCEQGICGSCLTPVLAGIPDHRDEVQTVAEHAANTQINICCSRSLSAVLELDI